MTVLLHGLRTHIDVEKTEKKRKKMTMGWKYFLKKNFLFFRHLHFYEIFPKLWYYHGTTYCCFDLRRKKNRTFEIPALFCMLFRVNWSPKFWAGWVNAHPLTAALIYLFHGYLVQTQVHMNRNARESNSTHCATERNDNFACLFRIMDVLKNSSFIIYNYSSSFQLFLSDIQFLMLYYHAQTQENRNFFMHNMSKNNKNKNFSISFCIFTDSLLYATLLDCHTLS